MSTVKLLARGTPDLAESENVKTKELWGTAGRLSGMEVTDLATVGTSQFSLQLQPGAWVHDGVVVIETTPVFLTFTKPNVSLNRLIYLIGQSNGFDSQAGAVYSLIGQDSFNSIQDAKNFAAIIAVYKYKLDGDVEQQVLFTSPAPAAGQDQWTAAPAANKWDIVNGTTAGRIYEDTNLQIQAIKLGALSSPQIGTIDKMALTLTTYAEDTAATVASGGSAVLTGPIAAGFVSIFINTIETTVPTVVVNALTTLNNLRTAVLANAAVAPLIDFPASLVAGGAGAATWTLVSAIRGNAAKFDIQVSFSPGTAAVSFTKTDMTVGGLQPYYTIEFAETPTGPSIYSTVTVYPPVTPLGPIPFPTYTVVEIPFATGTTLSPTFTNLYARLKQFGPVLGEVAISFIGLLVTFTETDDAIDLTPPLDQAHWAPGLSVTASSGSALGPHRLLNPIDHPDRSITALKYRIGSVDKVALDPRVVGNFYTYHNHLDSEWTLPPSSLALAPWNVIGDLSLKDCSVLIKIIAKLTFDDATSGLATQFNRDHEANKLDNTALTGHHRSAYFSPDEISLPGSSVSGMRILPLRSLTSPEPELAGDTNMDPPGISTKSQMFIYGSSFAIDGTATRVRDAVINRRKSQEIAPNLWGGSLETVGINSKDVAGAGLPAAATSEVIMEWSVEASKPYARVARTLAGLKEWFGFKKIDGYPMAALQNTRTNLFSGVVSLAGTVTMQAAPAWPAYSFPGRTNNASGKIYADMDTFWSNGPDIGGVASNAANSLNPNPAGFGVRLTRKNNRSSWGGGQTAVTGLGFNTVETGDIAVPPPPFSPAGPQRSNATWLYLPFRTKDIFDRVIVNLTAFNTLKFFGNFQQQAFRVMGFMAFPAYDAREVILANGAFAVTLPIPNPAFSNGYPQSPSGIVRREPWVLPPTGTPEPRGSGAPGVNGIYYDPATFFTSDHSAGLEDRATQFAAGQSIPVGSVIDPTPLPYYNKRAAAGAGALISGILIDANQGATAMSRHDFLLQGTFFVTEGASFSASTMVNLRDSSSAFKTLGGRTPDGIAICMNLYDWGLNNKVFQNSPTASSVICSPPCGVFMHEADIQIDGVMDGNYTPLLKL